MLLNNVTPGAIWHLPSEARKASHNAFVTRLPREIPHGKYMLRISNLDLDAQEDWKVFSIVVGGKASVNPLHLSPFSSPPLPLAEIGKLEAKTPLSDTTCIERESTCIKREPICSSLTATQIKREPICSSFNAIHVEREPSFSSLTATQLEREPSFSSLTATQLERESSFSQFLNECQQSPLHWLASVPSSVNRSTSMNWSAPPSVQHNPLVSPWLVSPICSQAATNDDSMEGGFGGPLGYGIGAC